MRPEADPVIVTPVEQDGKVLFDWQQPGWRSMLDGLQAVRDNRLTRSMDWGVSELEIPVGMLHFLKKRYPDLDSKDHQIKTNAWKKFLASPQSKPFRTRGRGGFLNRSVGGLADGRQSSGGDVLALPDVPPGGADEPAADPSLCRGPGGNPEFD